MNLRHRVWPWYIAAAGLILIDQASKIAVRHTFQLHQSLPVLGKELLRLTYVMNPGIAFGVRFPGRSVLLVFGWVAALALAIYLYHLARRRDALRWPVTLFLAGAVGNSIDRLLYGEVTDFIDLDFPDFLMERWPVFNVADSCVTIGVVWLFFLLLFTRGKSAHHARPSPPPSTLPLDNGSRPATSTD